MLLIGAAVAEFGQGFSMSVPGRATLWRVVVGEVLARVSSRECKTASILTFISSCQHSHFEWLVAQWLPSWLVPKRSWVRHLHPRSGYIAAVGYTCIRPTCPVRRDGCTANNCDISHLAVLGKLTVMVPKPTQPSIPLGSVNEDQLRLGRQRQIWFILFVDKCMDVQMKLWSPDNVWRLFQPRHSMSASGPCLVGCVSKGTTSHSTHYRSCRRRFLQTR